MVGEKSYSLHSAPQPMPINLYKSNPADESQASPVYDHVGRITHRLTVQAASNISATSLLRSQVDLARREREANRTTLIPIKQGGSMSSSLPSPSTTVPSTAAVASPRTPLLNIPSPSRAPSASPTHSQVLRPSKPKRLAISVAKPLLALNLSAPPNRLVHLLALGPMSFEALLTRTNIPQSELEGLLKQYATRVDSSTPPQSESTSPKPNDVYVLADQVYKDLRIWEWKYYTAAQRSQVIQTATAVYDKLGYGDGHSARRQLVDPKVRQAEAEKAAAEREAEQEARYAAETQKKEQEEREAMQKAVAEISAKKEERERVARNKQLQAQSSTVARGSPVLTPGGSSSSSMLQKVVKKSTRSVSNTDQPLKSPLTIASTTLTPTSAPSSATKKPANTVSSTNPSPLASPSLTGISATSSGAITSSSRRQLREQRERDQKEKKKLKEKEKETPKSVSTPSAFLSAPNNNNSNTNNNTTSASNLSATDTNSLTSQQPKKRRPSSDGSIDKELTVLVGGGAERANSLDTGVSSATSHKLKRQRANPSRETPLYSDEEGDSSPPEISITSANGNYSSPSIAIGLGIRESDVEDRYGDPYILVQKFQERYAMYEKLYKRLRRAGAIVSASSNGIANGKSPSTTGDKSKDLKRLLVYHTDLEELKKKIWELPAPFSNGSHSTKQKSSHSTNGSRDRSVERERPVPSRSSKQSPTSNGSNKSDSSNSVGNGRASSAKSGQRASSNHFDDLYDRADRLDRDRESERSRERDRRTSNDRSEKSSALNVSTTSSTTGAIRKRVPKKTAPATDSPLSSSLDRDGSQDWERRDSRSEGRDRVPKDRYSSNGTSSRDYSDRRDRDYERDFEYRDGKDRSNPGSLPSVRRQKQPPLVAERAMNHSHGPNSKKSSSSVSNRRD